MKLGGLVRREKKLVFGHEVRRIGAQIGQIWAIWLKAAEIGPKCSIFVCCEV